MRCNISNRHSPCSMHRTRWQARLLLQWLTAHFMLKGYTQRSSCSSVRLDQRQRESTEGVCGAQGASLCGVKIKKLATVALLLLTWRRRRGRRGRWWDRRKLASPSLSFARILFCKGGQGRAVQSLTTIRAGGNEQQQWMERKGQSGTHPAFHCHGIHEG